MLYLMTELQHFGVLLFCTAVLTLNLKEVKLELVFLTLIKQKNKQTKIISIISDHSFLTFCFPPHSHSVKFLLLLPQQCLLLNLQGLVIFWRIRIHVPQAHTRFRIYSKEMKFKFFPKLTFLKNIFEEPATHTKSLKKTCNNGQEDEPLQQ